MWTVVFLSTACYRLASAVALITWKSDVALMSGWVLSKGAKHAAYVLSL